MECACGSAVAAKVPNLPPAAKSRLTAPPGVKPLPSIAIDSSWAT